MLLITSCDKIYLVIAFLLRSVLCGSLLLQITVFFKALLEFRTFNCFKLYLCIAGGCLGAAFNACNLLITKFRNRYLKRHRFAQVLEVLAVAAVSGTIAFVMMYSSTVCRPLGQDDNVRLQVSSQLYDSFLYSFTETLFLELFFKA